MASMAMAPRNPVLCSNEVDDFVQAGLYPGGTGIVEDIAYVLWDYDGKRPPDSQVAVRLSFQPTDGSNEGKLIDNMYFSVGPSTDFLPSGDGGFIFSMTTQGQMRQNSNWHYFATKLRDNCGLEKGRFSQQGLGIKALKGSQLTLTRVDQPHRDLPEDAPAGAPGQQAGGRGNQKRTMLIPTAAIFAWDKRAAQIRMPARPGAAPAVPAIPANPAMTAPAAPAAAPAAPIAAAPAPAAPMVNGAAMPGTAAAAPAPTNVDEIITQCLVELVTAAPGNAVNVADLPNLFIDKIGPQGLAVPVTARINIMKQVKDIPYLTAVCAATGLTTDGATVRA